MFKPEIYTFLTIAFPNTSATEVTGIDIILPVGSSTELLEQIQNDPFAQGLGRLLCMAMGNPAGCIPLKVSIAPTRAQSEYKGLEITFE